MKRLLSYLIRDIQEILRLLRQENKLLSEENKKLKYDYSLVKKENTKLINQYHNNKIRHNHE